MNAGGTPPLPGAIGISELAVYDWQAPDGLLGGSPHLHLTCSECYVVVDGEGSLQTLTTEGYDDVDLSPGDVVWFTPGTIHRAVNREGLRVLVLMQNGGLPEAGDAVLTFPPEYLRDADRYRDAASVADSHGLPSPSRARERRDLAVAGFTSLKDSLLAGDPEPIREFHASAVQLIGRQLPEWRRRWQDDALATARRTGEQIAALERGDHSHLRDARVSRIQRPLPEKLGMCGRLNAYDPAHQGDE